MKKYSVIGILLHLDDQNGDTIETDINNGFLINSINVDNSTVQITQEDSIPTNVILKNETLNNEPLYIGLLDFPNRNVTLNELQSHLEIGRHKIKYIDVQIVNFDKYSSSENPTFEPTEENSTMYQISPCFLASINFKFNDGVETLIGKPIEEGDDIIKFTRKH